jgi:hypothetical protein
MFASSLYLWELCEHGVLRRIRAQSTTRSHFPSGHHRTSWQILLSWLCKEHEQALMLTLITICTEYCEYDRDSAEVNAIPHSHMRLHAMCEAPLAIGQKALLRLRCLEWRHYCRVGPSTPQRLLVLTSNALDLRKSQPPLFRTVRSSPRNPRPRKHFVMTRPVRGVRKSSNPTRHIFGSE